MGNKKLPWDKHEAVLLLDEYLETRQGGLPRLRIVKRVSSELRQMAHNRGQEIDDIYRNENGVSMRMRKLSYLFFENGTALKNL